MKINKATRPGPNTSKSTTVRGNVVAGGMGSKVVNPQGVRNGKPPTGVNPAAVAQFGSSLGNHVTEGRRSLKYSGEPYSTATPIGVKLGNEIATNVGKGGCGTGREVMARGSQSTYGSPAPGNPQPKGELFPGWPAKR